MLPNKPTELPPSNILEKLQILLKNNRDNPGSGFDMTAQSLIEKFKLPYFIKDSVLVNMFTEGEKWLQKFITVHPTTLLMKEDSKKMALTDYEVLITGETGTGKELIAKSMIGARTGSIKAVNCAGFPETLIESELFGHVKGAFTGAENSKPGLLQVAKDGVMFLDEVGELPMSVQAKLLRALQEKRVRRVGAVVDEDINCKFVCATHRNLRKMVEEDKFRRDLYARISTLELDILPLRDRREDIVPICESIEGGSKFLEHYKTALNDGTLDISLNVRSLQQYIIRFNVLGKVMLSK